MVENRPRIEPKNSGARPAANDGDHFRDFGKDSGVGGDHFRDDADPSRVGGDHYRDDANSSRADGDRLAETNGGANTGNESLSLLEILMPAGAYEHAKPEMPDRTKPAEYLPNLKPFDDDKRTVLVLDDYRETEMFMRGDEGFSHGELNARLTEENGFNAIRLQVGFNKPGYFDIENSLKTVNAGIEDGTLPLGNGDIINISLGLNKTFAEASKVLGIDINAENLQEKRPEILEAMREKAVDKDVPRKTRDWLRQMVGINDQIQALQKRGIVVATAEGNKGSDNFNLGLIAADKHYSSLNADGTVADYAAHNSLTTEARAEINFYARPLDLFDPTPFEQQTGTYKTRRQQHQTTGGRLRWFHRRAFTQQRFGKANHGRPSQRDHHRRWCPGHNKPNKSSA